MIKIYRKISRAGKYLLPVFWAAGLLGACSDDDAVRTPLDTPNVTNSRATVSSLTFTWDKVEGVSSYSCELKDTYGEVLDGTVTVSTEATFTGLQPNTIYTLEVYAYAAIDGANTTSKVATLTATTAAVVMLNMGELTVEVKGTTAVLSWEAVEHAESYSYTYMTGDGEVKGTTEATTLTLRQLAQGDYRVSVSAVPAEADEAYAASPAASVTFTIVQEKAALWTATGTYTSAGLNSSWGAKLTAWNDDSYTLSGWYGVEGYDLVFTVNADGEIEVPDYEESGDYFYVPTGRSDYAGVWIYPSDGYSKFENGTDGGSLYFWADEGYDRFTWEGVSSSLTIDNLVGSYLEKASGTDYAIWDWGTSDADNSFSYENNEVSIERGEGNTVVLRGFFYISESLVGTVDLDARTITFEPGQTFATWYTFAAETGVDVPVVATFDDDCTIRFEGWGAWYNGYTYVENAVSTLVKQ